MSHLGLALYFGTKVLHVLVGVTLAHMAANSIKITLGETGLIMLLQQHACSAALETNE